MGAAPTAQSGRRTNIAGQAAGGRESDAKQHGGKQARSETRNRVQTQRKHNKTTDATNPLHPKGKKNQGPHTTSTQALPLLPSPHRRSHISSHTPPFHHRLFLPTVFFNAPPAADVTSSTRHSTLLHSHSAQRAKAVTEGEIKKKEGRGEWQQQASRFGNKLASE